MGHTEMKRLPLDSHMDSRRVIVETRVIAPDDADDAGIHACLEYWKACKGTAFAPRWADFHLDELPPRLVPHVLVIDVARDPISYTYRFWGTAHTRYHQRDYTGKPISDMAEAWAVELLTDQYNQVLEARRPLVFLNTYDGVQSPMQSLRMPLSDDGTAVTQMISYVGRSDVSEAIKGLFVRD